MLKTLKYSHQLQRVVRFFSVNHLVAATQVPLLPNRYFLAREGVS